MNPILENKFRVRAFDVDANDRMKVNSILDYFQDAASNDAERLNFGYTNFVPRGLTWVLSWAKFEFIYLPQFAEEIKLQTWGKKQFKLYSIRDYLMFNSKDEIICKGTSAWLLIDSKSLRPKILTQLYPEIKMLDLKDALPDLPEKIIPKAQTEVVYSTQISYSDIDLNQHANNASYIKFMLDCFDQDFHKKHTMKTLTVSYNAQSRYGDEILLSKGTEKDIPLTHYVEVKNLSSSKIVFQAIVEWK